MCLMVCLNSLVPANHKQPFIVDNAYNCAAHVLMHSSLILNPGSILIIIGCPSISMKAVLSWITGVSFPPSFQVLLFSLSFNGVTSIKDLFPPKRSIFGITLPRVYIHVRCLQMTLQNIFVTQLLPTTFPFPRRQFTVEDSFW